MYCDLGPGPGLWFASSPVTASAPRLQLGTKARARKVTRCGTRAAARGRGSRLGGFPWWVWVQGRGLAQGLAQIQARGLERGSQARDQGNNHDCADMWQYAVVGTGVEELLSCVCRAAGLSGTRAVVRPVGKPWLGQALQQG